MTHRSLSRIFIGAAAVALSLGVAQFASGQDLAGALRAVAQGGQGVNRGIKADRAPRAAPSSQKTQTISVNLNGMTGTSILVRVPVAAELPPRPDPLITKSGVRKPIVACEGVVSVLTEVARRLQPGRCVT